MRTPDLHRIRTIRYGPPPPDLIGLEPLLYVRVPGIQIIHEKQGMLCPAAGPCHPSPAIPKPAEYHVYHYHITVKSPEPARHERASISVRLAGLGFPLRMTRCRGKDFHADKPEFLDADKNLKSFEKQTDNRRKNHIRLLAHSEQIHSARRCLSTHFLLI